MDHIEKLRKYQETAMQDSVIEQQQQEELHQQSATDSTDPPLMDSDDSFSNVQSSLQEILENPTMSYADKLRYVLYIYIQLLQRNRNEVKKK